MLTTKASAGYNSSVSSQMQGTASAPALGATGRTSRGPKISVKDLGRGGSKEPTAKEMVANLEDTVRKTLKAKQKEFDVTNFALKQRRAELEKLRLDLRDVQIDKEALGMTGAVPREERLQVVKTVFTRPFHTKDDKIEEKLATVESIKEEADLAVANGQVYEFMRTRVTSEIVEAKKKNSSLTIKLATERGRNADLAKRLIVANEALGKENARLLETRARVEEEIALWRKEIDEKSAAKAQRDGFHAFVANETARLRAQSERERAKLMADPAVAAHDKEHAIRLGVASLSIADESALYESTLKRLGVDPSDVTVEKVVAACRRQDEARREINRKRAAEEERIAYLQKQLLDSQRMLQAVLEDEKRTTTHTLAEGEAELGREEAAHTEESERLKYAQDSVMPVKIGLHRLLHKATGEEMDIKTANDATEALSMVLARVHAAVEEAKSKALDAGEIAELPEASLLLSSTGEAKPPIYAPHLEAMIPDWIVSTNNIRVGPDGEVTTATRKPTVVVTSDTGIAATGTAGDDDADDSDEDEVVDRNILGVLDRAELKKLSSSITVRLSKAQKPKK